MLLILEVILTISAWKRGWHGWALLPLGIGIVIAILAGSMFESVDFLVLFDIAIVIILAVMTAKGRKTEPKIQNTNMNSNPVENKDKTLPASDYANNNLNSHV